MVYQVHTWLPSNALQIYFEITLKTLVLGGREHWWYIKFVLISYLCSFSSSSLQIWPFYLQISVRWIKIYFYPGSYNLTFPSIISWNKAFVSVMYSFLPESMKYNGSFTFSGSKPSTWRSVFLSLKVPENERKLSF